jgi:hypothetical protein
MILQEAAPTWRLAEGGITITGWNQVAGIVRLPQICRSQQHRQQHGSQGQAQCKDSTTRSAPIRLPCQLRSELSRRIAIACEPQIDETMSELAGTWLLLS